MLRVRFWGILNGFWMYRCCLGKKNLNFVGSIYRPRIEIDAYLMVDKSTLRDKFLFMVV